MENTQKIIVVKTNAVSASGSRLFWMFSRNQLELVLKDFESTPVDSGQQYCQATTRWQEETLPVVCLEKYFGIIKTIGASPTKHLILKGARKEKDGVKLANIAIPIFTDVQTGPLTVQGRCLNPRFLPANSSAVLGAYELTGRRIVVVPDIYKIAAESGMILEQQSRP